MGYVRAIHVRNGQRVRAGQLLVELDPTLAGADEAQAASGLRTSEIVAARNAAMLAHIEGRASTFVPPAGTSREIDQVQRAFVRTSIAEYEAERQALEQQQAERRAEATAAQAEIAKLRQTLPLIDRQLEARKELSDRGYFSRLKLLEYEQLRIEHVQNIAVQQANALKARAAIAELDAQRARLRGTFGRTAVTALSESQEKSGLAREEVTKSRRRSAFQMLRAPVSGTVQQLAIATVGGVVQPAQALMVIVPDDAAIVVEANLPGKDVGFVREGQRVRLKLEAFNFTDYGVVPGIVESISRDAIELGREQQQQRDANGRPVQAGLVYAVRIRLLARSIDIGGRAQPIGPGLAVQAEIKTGERRIIDYLLSPIAKTLDEAGRER